jgi:hypothetical protein
MSCGEECESGMFGCSCCCASVTNLKGGLHPDSFRSAFVDLTLSETDALQTITHISKLLVQDAVHIIGVEAALVTIKRDVAVANAKKQLKEPLNTGDEDRIRANTPVNVSLYTIPGWSTGDLERGGFDAIDQEQSRNYITTASLTAQNPHWTAHEDLFGYFADGGLFAEYNSPTDQYGVRLIVRYVPRLQFSPAYHDPLAVMQHYWKCSHGSEKEFLEGFYAGTSVQIPSVEPTLPVNSTDLGPSKDPTPGGKDLSFYPTALAPGVEPSDLLLDTNPNSVMAFSVRKIDKHYTGYCFIIRETTGNTEAYIGFDANGDLDTAAISAHCGTSFGYIKTWFDQSGGQNDAVQYTYANQPYIYNGSATLVQNGKPVVSFHPGKVLAVASLNVAKATGGYTFLVGGSGDGSTGFVMLSSSDEETDVGIARDTATTSTLLNSSVDSYHINGVAVTDSEGGLPGQNELFDGMARQGICRISNHKNTGATERTYELSTLPNSTLGADAVTDGNFAPNAGSELVTNGAFAEDISGWLDTTAGTGSASWDSSGKAQLSNPDASWANVARLHQEVTVVVGKNYRVQATKSGATDGVGCRFSLGDAQYNNSYLYTSTYTVAVDTTVTATSTSLWIMLLNAENTGDATFDDVTVTEVLEPTWTKTAGATISGGVARIVSATGEAQSISQTGYAGTEGKVVEVSVDVTDVTTGALKLYFAGGADVAIPTSVGTHVLEILNDGTSGTLYISRSSGATDVTIDNLTVKEVIGTDSLQLQEYVTWHGTKSSAAAAIESNINTYFGVHGD